VINSAESSPAIIAGRGQLFPGDAQVGNWLSWRRSDTDELGILYGLELMNDIVALLPVDWAAAQKKMPSPW
jgi:hypothetical protein